LSLVRRLVFGEHPRRTAVRVLVLAAASCVTFKWVLIPIRTEGSSMLPTYSPDRFNLVNRFAYVAASPSRGDVIAIRMAGPHVLYVKRIIGMPGERVSIDDGLVSINGVALPEPYVKFRRPWRVDAVTLRVGNPQCVVLGDVTEERLHSLASALAVHPHFPHGTNVELATVEHPGRVRILIWERGVGPTEASGTGACAAAVAAIQYGGAARDVQIVSPGGSQRVEWTDDGLFLTGWAELIAEVCRAVTSKTDFTAR
jgi:diaminopimelate epimerase